jgi:hypothetical protein
MADFHLVVYAGPTRTGSMIYEAVSPKLEIPRSLLRIADEVIE